MAKLTREQIRENRVDFVKWINEHVLVEFQADKGRSIEEYLSEYNYIPDIHYRLALDFDYPNPLSLYDETTDPASDAYIDPNY